MSKIDIELESFIEESKEEDSKIKYKDLVSAIDYLLNTGRGKKKSLEWLLLRFKPGYEVINNKRIKLNLEMFRNGNTSDVGIL